MAQRSTFLVFGATGGTGKHFIAQALQEGHRVRALVRTPAKLGDSQANPNLEVHQGSITDVPNLDELVRGADYVVSMLGDKQAQNVSKINTAFVKQLVPAMRRHGVKRLLYQAGGLSKPYKGYVPWSIWVFRTFFISSFRGQHEDNEAVMVYLATEATDLEWIVHRAGIIGDGPSKGTLQRSSTSVSIGNFRDCAEYSHRLIRESAAVHTSDFSHYVKS